MPAVFPSVHPFPTRVGWLRSLLRSLPALLGAVALVLLSACGRRPTPLPLAVQPAPPAIHYVPTVVGAPPEAKPWITHVAFFDLDRDGLIDGLACDAAGNAVVWLRQSPAGQFTEITLADHLPAPVHASAVDFDRDGDPDILVACMGRVLPTNDRIGSVVILENAGNGHFVPHTVIADTARVTDVESGDFNGDGRLDLAVAKFGYYEGAVTWLENLGDWTFREHTLLDLPGAINVCVADLTGDGQPDIAAVVSQQYEEIYLFENKHGAFEATAIFGSTNEDFGSSNLSLCDVNRDGKLDLLYTNGDGFDYAEPGSRPWHGVQWLENRGGRVFRNHRIADFPGAYSPVGVDLNGDGAIDIVCVSGFNDWKNPASVSLMAFINDGREHFTPVPLAHEPTHLITVAAADIDGDGRPELLTGGFFIYPPWDRINRLTFWRGAPPPP